VESGRRALEGDRAEEAIPLLRQALERIDSSPPPDRAPDPTLTADVEALLGRALVLTDHYAEAADHLGRSVSLGHADVGTLLYLGSAQWESQQLEPAVASLRRAAERATGTSADFLAHHQLGRLLLWMGRAGDAVEPLERAVSLRGDAFDARLDLARALDRSGALDRAVTVYGQALEMNPSSHHAHWGMAQALLRLGRRDEAQEHLAVYRRLYEENKQRTQESILTDARMARARELFEERKLDEAEQIVASLPETAETLEALARIRATAGNLDGAVTALERAVAIAPDRDDLRRLLAEARLLAQEASNGG
jgi:tetratricopeptide (TPR) repeat protein